MAMAIRVVIRLPVGDCTGDVMVDTIGCPFLLSVQVVIHFTGGLPQQYWAGLGVKSAWCHQECGKPEAQTVQYPNCCSLLVAVQSTLCLPFAVGLMVSRIVMCVAAE